MTLHSTSIFWSVFALSLSAPVAGDSLLHRLLRIAGLTAAPSQMRGASDEVAPGDVWVADLEKQTPAPVTRTGGYRWPVFAPDGDGILALKDDQLMRLAPGGTAANVRRLRNAVKLVGFDEQNPDLLLVVLESPGDRSPLGLLSLKTGTMTALPFDRSLSSHRRMLNHIRGQERVYDTSSVYLKSESKAGMTRTLEWTDVYFKRGDAPPRNVSLCDGVDCGQPSLSRDGRRIVFVKSASVP